MRSRLIPVSTLRSALRPRENPVVQRGSLNPIFTQPNVRRHHPARCFTPSCNHLDQASTERTDAPTGSEKDFKPPQPSNRNVGPSRGSGITMKVKTLFTTLTALGIGLTVYGVYEFYSSFETWPKELREDLRAAIKARNMGDARRSEAFFRKALATARSLPAKDLSPSPVLKTTGIAIALGSLLEEQGQLAAAYDVYAEALDEVLEQGAFKPVNEGMQKTERTPEERMRAVALSQKLGDLAQCEQVLTAIIPFEEAEPIAAKVRKGEVTGTSDSFDPAERHLVWSVEELLRLTVPSEERERILLESEQGKESSAAAAISSRPQNSVEGGGVDGGGGILISELGLPPWVGRQEIGASIEALGAFYAKRGKAEFAVPLYLQALSILMPPNSNSKEARERGQVGAPTVADRCRAAVLMNNLSQLFVNQDDLDASASRKDGKDEKEKLRQAQAWAAKGLEIADITIRKAGFDEVVGEAKKPGKIEKIESVSEERTHQVKMECLRAQITLLYNLGIMAEMGSDPCSARKYFMRAYKQSELAGPSMRQARNKCSQALTRLERRNSIGAKSDQDAK
ncbi:hypothetical protein IE53DRAFT_390370 [Violaceomyces palustris]|uniref:Uncharacterized protein n=1 Tax=Violaceomyces palustris TaxID=1673888 RepID=A0ACD0NP03_9BASI|nr:hypothetical protein IE53DRAFT_390370 [Violaceomyces palustris]